MIGAAKPPETYRGTNALGTLRQRYILLLRGALLMVHATTLGVGCDRYLGTSQTFLLNIDADAAFRPLDRFS